MSAPKMSAVVCNYTQSSVNPFQQAGQSKNRNTLKNIQKRQLRQIFNHLPCFPLFIQFQLNCAEFFSPHFAMWKPESTFLSHPRESIVSAGRHKQNTKKRKKEHCFSLYDFLIYMQARGQAPLVHRYNQCRQLKKSIETLEMLVCKAAVRAAECTQTAK